MSDGSCVVFEFMRISCTQREVTRSRGNVSRSVSSAWRKLMIDIDDRLRSVKAEPCSVCPSTFLFHV